MKKFPIAIGILLTATALAQAQGRINPSPNRQAPDGQIVQLQPANKMMPNVPWVVAVIHRLDAHKFIERTRKQTRGKVGVPGSMQEYNFNLATGMVIDDKGHIVTRLSNFDPQDKEPTISIKTSEGVMLPAKLIGLDYASGFAVLEVANLNVALPPTATAPAKDQSVKILSVDFVRKDAAQDNRAGFYVEPEIRTLSGQIEPGNLFAKERGVWTLRATNLLSKNDSAVALTADNQLVGIARYAGYQRADLFPIGLIRDTIAKRVLDKRDSVPAGWLGVSGLNLNQLSAEQLATYNVQAKAGVLVRDVTAESPAATSGIKQGDVITALDDFKINSTGDLGAVLSAMPAGKAIKLQVLRKQEPLAIPVTLGARSLSDFVFTQTFEPQVESGASQVEDLKRRIDELQAQYRAHLKEPPSRERNETLRELNIEIRNYYDRMREISEIPKPSEEGIKADQVSKEPVTCTLPAGFTASEMTKQLADYMGAPKSLFVKKVLPQSAAEVAGLKAADVIVGDVQNALSCRQLEAIFSKAQPSLTLKVIRNKQPLIITINQKQ